MAPTRAAAGKCWRRRQPNFTAAGRKQVGGAAEGSMNGLTGFKVSGHRRTFYT